MRPQLIATIYGHQRSVVFACIAFSILIACFAGLCDTRVACIMLLLLAVTGACRFQTVANPSTNPTAVIFAGLVWATATGLICGEVARSGQTMPLVLGGVIVTGVAFGAAFVNAGAPRFAKIKTVLFVAPYAVFASLSQSTGMIVILCQFPLWVAGIFMLIDRAHESNAKLFRAQRFTEHLAYHDALTQLPNRARFMERLAAACEIAPRNVETASYVLYLDLDGFKTVNDTLGHGAGDDLLRAVATRFQAVMRPCDMVGRLGGDEFAIILSDLSLTEVEDVGNRLIAVATEPFLLGGLPAIQIGVSVGGAALAPPPDIRRTLHAADTMLYAAKQAGKGTLRLA